MKCLSTILLSIILLLLVPLSANAATYYLSPSGNDTNNGSPTSPWKTLDKANTAISSGDTVILKNGIYAAYLNITKSNTTWRAENKLQAIVDGGFGPALLEGRWDRIDEAYASACTGKDTFAKLIGIHENAANVTIDGLTLRNSCGKGITVAGDDFVFQNNRMDWTLIAGIDVEPQTNGVKLLNNTLTRITFNDQLRFYTGQGYKVNVSMYMSGDDMVVRGNTFAWGRGEMASPFSKNMIYEDNVVVGMKNNFYIGWTENMTARNNLFFSPETENTANTHWAYPFGDSENRNKINWRMSGRSEDKGDKIKGMNGPKNVMFYNNIAINNSVGFDGYHRQEIKPTAAPSATPAPEIKNCFGNEFQNLYYSHNTIITRSQSTNNNLLVFIYTPCEGKNGGTSANSSINGIIENNIFDNSKNRNADISFGFDSNDQVTIRNNIFPVGTQQIASNTYTDNPGFSGTIEQLKLLHLQIPSIGATTSEVDSQDLRNLVNLNHFRLSQSSPAINAGSTAGAVGSTQIPAPARAQDFFLANRVGLPDMGAIEFGGVPGPTYTPAPSPTAGPSPTGGDEVEDWDLDNDGDIDVFDFNRFVKQVMIGTKDWSNLNAFVSAFRSG